MLVARVRGNEVEQDPDAPLAGFDDERVQLGERSELGVDRAVVRDVVAPVTIRRREGRVEPDSVDAEPFEVVEALSDSGEISDAVVVRVGKRARVDLAEDTAAPPRLPGGRHDQRYPGIRGPCPAARAPHRSGRAQVPRGAGLEVGGPWSRELRRDDESPRGAPRRARTGRSEE